MAQRPTVTDLANYLGITLPDSSTDAAEYGVLSDAVATSLEQLEDIVSTTVVENEGYSLDPTGNVYPNTLRTAVLIQASRLFKRRTTPEGFANFGGEGVRISSDDPDVWPLIERFTVSGFA